MMLFTIATLVLHELHPGDFIALVRPRRCCSYFAARLQACIEHALKVRLRAADVCAKLALLRNQ